MLNGIIIGLHYIIYRKTVPECARTMTLPRKNSNIFGERLSLIYSISQEIKLKATGIE